MRPAWGERDGEALVLRCRSGEMGEGRSIRRGLERSVSYILPCKIWKAILAGKE